MAVIRDAILPFKRQRAFSLEQALDCFFQLWQEFLRESSLQITFLFIVVDLGSGKVKGSWPLPNPLSSHLFS